MTTRTLRFSLPTIVLVLAQLACNLAAAPTQDPASTLDALHTQSAQTLEAMASSAAQTATARPVFTPTSTSTFLPGFNSPTPLGPIKTSTAVTPCNWIEFIDDISYDDGSAIGRNTPFTKIWRVKNIGTCSWTTAYDLVFFNGEAMNAPSEVSITETVAPGQMIDLKVDLISPNKDGKFRANFKLRDGSGVLFGAGASASTPIWVELNVVGVTFAAYDFAFSACDAQWNNNNQPLLCPGTEGDGNGYVIRVDAPKLENGSPAGQVGMVTYPKDSNNGFIRGVYPPMAVQDGDRFRSILNCRYNSTGCNVVFRLDYQIGGGAVNNLGHWNEAYEGLYYTVDIDLSFLKGQNVKFILTVEANGSSFKDFAYWIGPRLLRQGVPPPTAVPTLTFTPTYTPSPTSTPSQTPSPTATGVGP